jgi:hypothetical protein
MDHGRKPPASPEKAIGAVVLFIGIAGLAVLAFACRRLGLLERAVEMGDLLVLGVFGAFGAFCAWLGWRLIRTTTVPGAVAAEAAPARPARRVTVSHACAAAGVVLLMLSVLLPAAWHPVAFLFAGHALLADSHGLTPCVERLEQLRKARDAERQL